MPILQDADEKSISKEIIRIEHELFHAIQKKDISKISPLLTDSFTYQNPAYGEIHRAEFLQNIQSIPVEIESVSSGSLSVKVLTDRLAMITGIQESKVIQNGQTQISRVAFTDIFVKVNEHWFLDYANGIDIPDNSESI